MKKLVIKPPKRRESVRVKSRSESAASTPTTSTSSGDNIEVALPHGPVVAVVDDEAIQSPIEDSKDSEVNVKHPLVIDLEMNDAVSRSSLKMLLSSSSTDHAQDEDDAVTEYDFSNEKEDEDESDDEDVRGIFKDTTKDIITISSDDEGAEAATESPVDQSPWLRMTLRERMDWERMYCSVQTQALRGDWEFTAQYQDQKDAEMERFVAFRFNIA